MSVTYRLLFFPLVILLGLCVFGGAVAAADDIDVNVFVKELAPYGQWTDSSAYGRVWIPSGMSKDWRPYTDGRWVWTDEHGWTWVSDQEWGWAPFHYGRWANDARHGWMWIPDTQWGPAWVAWRTGDSHIGWAPLPPEVRWRKGSPLRLNSSTSDDYIPGDRWIFVNRRQFIEPDVRQYVLPRATVVTLLPATRNVTYYAPSGGRVINRSLDLSSIEEVLGVSVPRLRVARVDTFDEYKSHRRDAKHVYLYEPRHKADKKAVTSLVQVPVEKPRMERPERPVERKVVHGRPNRNLKSEPSLDKQRGKDVGESRDSAKKLSAPADHGREKNNSGEGKGNSDRGGHMSR